MKYIDYDDNGNKNDNYGDCDAIILLTAATKGKLALLEGAVVVAVEVVVVVVVMVPVVVAGVREGSHM
jgi:hypothetical protein